MSGLPAVIATDRVRLIPFTAEDAADLLAGRRQERWHPQYPQPGDVDAAALRRADDEAGAWGPRHVVVAWQAVGSIGCLGDPASGEVEVGYGVVPDLRGQGVATEALRALAAAVEGVGVGLRAAVRPENAASLRVLARCGFTALRGSDEEGRLVLGRRPAP